MPLTTKVLVVEDDPDVREALCEIIEYEDYAVDQAGNGREALDYLRQNAVPALVIIDLMMPVMNGLEFLAVVREDTELQRVPVLVLSAQPREQTARTAGAAGFMRKPVQLEPFLAAVRELCSSRVA